MPGVDPTANIKFISSDQHCRYVKKFCRAKKKKKKKLGS